MPDSLPATVIGFLTDPVGVIAVIAAVVFIVSMWRTRHSSEVIKKSSHLPWTVSLSSFPPESAVGSGAASGAAAPPPGQSKAHGEFVVAGKIASLSVKKAVFVIPTNAFAVGNKVYFHFDSSHFSGQYFAGHVSKVRQDQVSDQFRVTLNVLDKPFTLSRSMLKKLMLPIAS